ncbi:MAG: hypothetical protein U0640_01745 [Phycisphaerales bacterium]
MSSQAFAWDGAGHRMVTRVALQGLDPSMPAWLKDEASIIAMADQAQTPDRWRSVSAMSVPQLKHVNDPDHYIDLEDLHDFGLELRSIPVLRYEYVKTLTAARAKPDFAGEPIDPKKDVAKTMEYPGFLPYATLESYGRVVSAFKVVRTLEAMKDPSREPQIEAAKWNARINIGQLSHYIGDAAQPLHTTRHHHGWKGDNPNGYSTENSIHGYIDGKILKLHDINDEDVKTKCDFGRTISTSEVWNESLTHIERSFKEVEPLYQLKKSGEMEQQKGKDFITSRLADASSQLSAMLETAWLESAPTPKEIQDMKNFEGEKGPGVTAETKPQPASEQQPK